MGPASSPKTAAELAADTTNCAASSSTSAGETVVYQGDNPDTNTVTVYDTITVAEGEGTGPAADRIRSGIEIGLSTASDMDLALLSGSAGPSNQTDSISNAAVQGVYLLRSVSDSRIGNPRGGHVDRVQSRSMTKTEYNSMKFDACPSYSIHPDDPERVPTTRSAMANWSSRTQMAEHSRFQYHSRTTTWWACR